MYTIHTCIDGSAVSNPLCVFRDHRRLFVGDSRGRVFSWTVSDNLGQCFLNSYTVNIVCS